MKIALRSAATTLACVIAVVLLTVPAGTAPTAGSPGEVGLSAERLDRIARMLQRRIAAGDLAGSVVAVARKGRVAYVNAQGVIDLESRQPNGEIQRDFEDLVAQSIAD